MRSALSVGVTTTDDYERAHKFTNHESVAHFAMVMHEVCGDKWRFTYAHDSDVGHIHGHNWVALAAPRDVPVDLLDPLGSERFICLTPTKETAT